MGQLLSFGIFLAKVVPKYYCYRLVTDCMLQVTQLIFPAICEHITMNTIRLKLFQICPKTDRIVGIRKPQGLMRRRCRI